MHDTCIQPAWACVHVCAILLKYEVYCYDRNWKMTIRNSVYGLVQFRARWMLVYTVRAHSKLHFHFPAACANLHGFPNYMTLACNVHELACSCMQWHAIACMQLGASLHVTATKKLNSVKDTKKDARLPQYYRHPLDLHSLRAKAVRFSAHLSYWSINIIRCGLSLFFLLSLMSLLPPLPIHIPRLTKHTK